MKKTVRQYSDHTLMSGQVPRVYTELKSAKSKRSKKKAFTFPETGSWIDRSYADITGMSVGSPASIIPRKVVKAKTAKRDTVTEPIRKAMPQKKAYVAPRVSMKHARAVLGKKTKKVNGLIVRA